MDFLGNGQVGLAFPEQAELPSSDHGNSQDHRGSAGCDYVLGRALQDGNDQAGRYGCQGHDGESYGYSFNCLHNHKMYSFGISLLERVAGFEPAFPESEPGVLPPN